MRLCLFLIMLASPIMGMDVDKLVERAAQKEDFGGVFLRQEGETLIPPEELFELRGVEDPTVSSGTYVRILDYKEDEISEALKIVALEQEIDKMSWVIEQLQNSNDGYKNHIGKITIAIELIITILSALGVINSKKMFKKKVG